MKRTTTKEHISVLPSNFLKSIDEKDGILDTVIFNGKDESIKKRFRTDIKKHIIKSSIKFFELICSTNGWINFKDSLREMIRFRKSYTTISGEKKYINIEAGVFLNILKHRGFVHIKTKYVKDKNCTQYELGDKLGSELVIIFLETPKFKDYKFFTIKEVIKPFGRCKEHGFDIQRKQIRNFKKIKFTGDIQYMINEVKKKNPYIKNSSIIKGVYQVLNIQNGNFWASYSSSKRFYSIITSLKKEFRDFIRVDGEKLAEIDINSSQPYITFCLFKNSKTKFSKKEQEEIDVLKKLFDNNNFYNAISNGFYLFETNQNITLSSAKNLSQNDIDYVNDYFKDNLYENKELKELSIRNYSKYALMKILFSKFVKTKNFKDLSNMSISYKNYSKDELSCNDKSIYKSYNDNRNSTYRNASIFAAMFPNFFAFIEFKKQGFKKQDKIHKELKNKKFTRGNWLKNNEFYKNYPKLWFLGQKIESEIIQRVIKTVEPDVFFTVHDSILVKSEYEDAIKNALEDELKYLEANGTVNPSILEFTKKTTNKPKPNKEPEPLVITHNDKLKTYKCIVNDVLEEDSLYSVVNL